jgi:hypothetical protein
MRAAQAALRGLPGHQRPGGRQGRRCVPACGDVRDRCTTPPGAGLTTPTSSGRIDAGRPLRQRQRGVATPRLPARNDSPCRHRSRSTMPTARPGGGSSSTEGCCSQDAHHRRRGVLIGSANLTPQLRPELRNNILVFTWGCAGGRRARRYIATRGP